MEFETVRFNSEEIAGLRKLTRIPAGQWHEWESEAPSADDAQRVLGLKPGAAIHLATDREAVEAAFRVCDSWADWDGEMSRHGFTSAEIDTLLGLHNALERLLEAAA